MQIKLFYSIIAVFLGCSVFIRADENQGFKYIDSALIAEGVIPETIDKYRIEYENLLNELKNELQSSGTIYDKHESLFDQLHSKWLNKYKEITKLSSLFNSKTYNCVTASLIYYAFSKDLNLDVVICESPYHVYLSFFYNQSKIGIELTNPGEGFDFERDEEGYIEFLLQYKYITQEEIELRGIEDIYNEYITESKEIPIERLLAIDCTNRAVFSILDKDIDNAFDQITKAALFTKDSATIAAYNEILSSIIGEIEDDIDRSEYFLRKLLTSVSVSLETEKEVIKYGGRIIWKLMLKGKNDEADSLFLSLKEYLLFSSKNDDKLVDLDFYVKGTMIESNLVRGETEKAYLVSKRLFDEYKTSSKVQDIYIRTTGIFVNDLQKVKNFKKMGEIAELIYDQLPEVKSIEDMYIDVILLQLYGSNYNFDEFEKSKKLLVNAINKRPESTFLKETLAKLYREMAMENIRKRKNEEALKFLEEGLQLYPENKDLQIELKLTKELLKKR